MKGKLIVLGLNKTEIVDFEGTDDELSSIIKKHIGGWMEIVHPKSLEEPYCMVVDEEGRLKGLKTNIIASALYNYKNIGYEPIVGTVVLLKMSMGNEGPDLDILSPLESFKLSSYLIKFMANEVTTNVKAKR